MWYDTLCREISSNEVRDEQTEVPNIHSRVYQETDDGGVETVRDAADGDNGERRGFVRHGGEKSSGVRRPLHALYCTASASLE